MASNWCSFIWKNIYVLILICCLESVCCHVEADCIGSLGCFSFMLCVQCRGFWTAFGDSLPFSFLWIWIANTGNSTWTQLMFSAIQSTQVPRCSCGCVCTWDGKYQWLLLSSRNSTAAFVSVNSWGWKVVAGFFLWALFILCIYIMYFSCYLFSVPCSKLAELVMHLLSSLLFWRMCTMSSGSLKKKTENTKN